MALRTPKVAFVTGCNGISGNAIVEHLIRQPKEEWSRIVVTSRSPLKNYWQDPRVEFVAIDFLEPVETVISKISRSCEKVTHAYYTSYVHTDDFAKLRDYNVPLFKTFLVAIDTVAGQNLQRICLQTGGKVPCLMLFISAQDILIFMRSTTGLTWVQCSAQ
jgi:nucleoside-diphosphate-sugar epimerase